MPFDNGGTALVFSDSVPEVAAELVERAQLILRRKVAVQIAHEADTE